MEVLEETTTGDFTTGRQLRILCRRTVCRAVFARGRVCGESNVVKDVRFDARGRAGMARSKEQLKMLF